MLLTAAARSNADLFSAPATSPRGSHGSKTHLYNVWYDISSYISRTVGSKGRGKAQKPVAKRKRLLSLLLCEPKAAAAEGPRLFAASLFLVQLGTVVSGREDTIQYVAGRRILFYEDSRIGGKKTAAVEPHTLRASEAKATRAQQAHTPGGVLSSLAPKHNPFSFATRVDACNMGLLRNTVRMDEAQVRGSFWVG